MMDDSTHTLLQRALDGEATPDERAVLAALAADDPAIRDAQADLKATVDLLNHVEMVEPPADLKRRIMAALPDERYARAESRSTASEQWSLAAVFGALRDALTARPALGYGYALALGAVIGVAAYVAVFDPATMPAAPEAYGTLVAPDAALTFSEEHRVAADQLGGTVRFAQSGDEILVGVELDPRAEVDVRLTFDPDVLRWNGLARLGGTAQAALTEQPGEVRLTLDGAGHYRLSFASTGLPASLTLTVFDGEVAVYERVFSALAPDAD